MAKDKLTLHREGEFSFIVGGPHHCGIAHTSERQDARYEVDVCCKPVLDARGFLFEQRTVDEFFQRITSVRSSCEQLVMRIAVDLLAKIKNENPNIQVHWIQVRVIAAPYKAHMTYRMHV